MAFSYFCGWLPDHVGENESDVGRTAVSRRLHVRTARFQRYVWLDGGDVS
ncbi:hypothetical protein PNH38_16945 [Anoxybacillus rupiensis]|uniref:Transposase n=1 Tax=Anoxybacteroides rupiense TaxID=311460 RepID=A0ABD5IWU6_9BACL|nr:MULTISPECIES: hypothetical protein [Anoxybacillus]MBS2771888.1 hypothetical protein [Anoxybacillus rupiensis]MDE8565534.1 hypothetical protein [Anoxybacillus rupiensis]MED5052822.1 hypothetical protein [Anoxybacillus rupiensis]QHC02810.1 hypothetical protein GRQ40_01530 [Anoxybacillus sp. PDR2]